MTPLLVNVVQFDEGQTVMSADDTHRLGMLGFEFGVEDEIDAGHGIVLLDDTAEARHGRTEEPEVVVSPVGPLVIADKFARPRIVGDAARKDDVGIAEVLHAGVERARLVVVVVITGITHRRTTVRVVHFEFPTHLVDDLPPPGLLDTYHIVALLTMRAVGTPIPGFVVGRSEPTFESGITVAEDGDAKRVLRLGCPSQGGHDGYQKCLFHIFVF